MNVKATGNFQTRDRTRVHRRVTLAIASLILLLLAAPASTLAGEHAGEGHSGGEYCDYFEETGNSVCFGFRSYWNEYGGLDAFGLPITGEIQENGMTVQYFERARFEWRPGVWPERHDVLLGRLGSELTRERSSDEAFASTSAADGCAYFEATGHNVCGAFADRWKSTGGLALFGYPISEAFEFDGTTMQYFERARFEHHPGTWPEKHDVLLGHVGSVAASLGDIRAVTEQYRDVSMAEADGYVPIEINGDLCVADKDEGAMGIHYLNESLVSDQPIDIMQPQLLVYIPTDNGLELGAVEYFTPDVGQEHPILFDRYMDGPISNLEGIPVHFQLHAWVWKENPAGMFARYNPDLSCP